MAGSCVSPNRKKNAQAGLLFQCETPKTAFWGGRETKLAEPGVPVGPPASREIENQGSIDRRSRPGRWDLPPTPKGMCWRTYQRYVDRFDGYERMLDEGLMLLAARFLGRIQTR